MVGLSFGPRSSLWAVVAATVGAANGVAISAAEPARAAPAASTWRRETSVLMVISSFAELRAPDDIRLLRRGWSTAVTGDPERRGRGLPTGRVAPGALT